MSIEPIIATYLAVNFLMTAHAWWLDYRLNRALHQPQPRLSVVIASFVWCTFTMIPMRLLCKRKKRRAQ